jgi:23S rRNA (uracil1939-C5)-methyltransferase
VNKNSRQDHSAKPKRDSELESLLHSEHIVTVEKMAVGGDGVARIPFKDKSLVVFIDRVAPNDELKIKITSVEKSFLKAKIVSILKPSEHRRAAPCEYFEKCGGCSWQHINDVEQVRQKENLLQELFKKFLPDVAYAPEKTVVSDLKFNYRNRIQLKHQDNQFGYFQSGTHTIVDINSCLIADKLISDQITVLKKKLKPSPELKKYELRINQDNQFESYRIGEAGEGLAFSQVNNQVNEKLVSAVTNLVASINPASLTELYSGSGNFTFKILESTQIVKIECVELNPELTAFTHKKMLALSLQKRLISFTSNCDTFVSRRALSKDFILLDPPRSGCSEIVVQKVAEASPQDLIYISCHPVNLARDLKRLLTGQPKYQLIKIQIFDMFPQTDHFETLVHLSLIES